MATLFKPNLFKTGLFNPAMFNGVSSPVPPPGGCTPYAQRADIEMYYGAINVKAWADLDNDGNLTTIENRIAWALCEATNFFDEYLNEGPYEIPFKVPYTERLINMCARYAGCVLYEQRGIVDVSDQPVNAISANKAAVLVWLNDILARRVRILGLGHTIDYPAAIIAD